MSHKAPVANRSVKPRKPVRKDYLPIISFTPESVYRESDNTYLDSDDIFALIATEPPSIVVAQGIAPLLYELHRKFHIDPDWQFCVSPIERQRWSSNRTETVIRSRDTAVSFMGFKGKRLPDGPRGGKRNEANRYHATLDPITFGRVSIQEIDKRDIPTVDKLYIWATNVRRFCRKNHVSLRPTSGALAAQFLRDKQFYPWSRRKVPSATNDKVRPQLPGNYYSLFEDEEKEFDAYYMDQVAAHHNAALAITFPHSNELKAHGRFRTLTDKPGIRGNKILTGYGLFYVKISVPHIPPGKFPPPWAKHPGEHTAYIYSNELPTAKSLGVQIQYVIAAWVSNAKDRGLNRFAQWSLAELKKTPDYERNWIKPILLSTYGILAATPRIHRIGYAQATGGVPAMYPAGASYIPVLERTTKKPTEPSYANVIHRGMIEAETRLRSLALAQEMYSQGHRIIAVYADSVFIHARDADGNNLALPLPPEGWTVQNVLTRLRFHNPVSFTSDQLTKLPGIPTRDTVLRSSFGVRHSKPQLSRL